MVRWLGFKPAKVTHSSDNFDRLYEFAEALIQRGKAYVCHCTSKLPVAPTLLLEANLDSETEIVEQRGGGEGKKPRYACPHRNRPSSESLTEFRAMRDGKYRPNEAALRMKQNLEDGNPQMWDLFAYRIPQKKEKKQPLTQEEAELQGEEEEEEDVYTGSHYRTGDKWKVYPTYDFTHCLCDSFEGITHSLCTTEFELSRVSYEWLNNELEVYKPMQREYGRLSVSGTILSKRKISKLVNEGYVRGWDDPRLYTLPALRRRGIPPGAILSFVNELGVTKAPTVIESKRFETSVRRYLEATVPRLMLVLDPIKVVIDNLPEDHLEMLEMPFSKDSAYGVHRVPFTKTVYIERSDFREIDAPDYHRLAPGKTVGLLKVPFPITATTFLREESSGVIVTVHAMYEKPEDGVAPKKPKGWIHWVAASSSCRSPIHTKVRVINPLFRSANPSTHPNGFLSDINPFSEEVFPSAMIETGFEEIRRRAPWPAAAGEKEATFSSQNQGAAEADANATHSGSGGPPETVRFQGMRMGYFCIDKDSQADETILNQIVSLKEDAGK